ncbi:MAG: hypothetical protein HY717_07795 [Planctomycetes bacterium]|nr:hypothetical protein [Planctomycetota bacterium]
MENIPVNLQSRTDRFTLLAFLAMVVMLFSTFTAAYLIRRTAPDWQPIQIPSLAWINSLFLGASSAALELARRRPVRLWLGAAAALGAVFLIGQASIWRLLAARGILLSGSPHGAFFYTLTAVHGLHLLGGLGFLLRAFFKKGAAGLTLCAWYWHFMGGAWFYILFLLTFA